MANPPMTSFDSMNGPSVMTWCPFSRRTVLTVFGPWSCSPPTILPLWVYSLNQPPARHGGFVLVRRQAVPTILVFRGADEKQHEFHGQPPQDVRRTASTEIDRLARRILGVVDGRPDLDSAGPLFGHGNRLVEVGHVDDGESADDLFRLDERAVRDADFAVLS